MFLRFKVLRESVFTQMHSENSYKQVARSAVFMLGWFQGSYHVSIQCERIPMLMLLPKMSMSNAHDQQGKQRNHNETQHDHATMTNKLSICSTKAFTAQFSLDPEPHFLPLLCITLMPNLHAFTSPRAHAAQLFDCWIFAGFPNSTLLAMQLSKESP